MENSDSFRMVITFLNDERADYYIYQQCENKEFHLVIRNIYPSSSTNVIGITIQEICFTIK